MDKRCLSKLKQWSIIYPWNWQRLKSPSRNVAQAGESGQPDSGVVGGGRVPLIHIPTKSRGTQFPSCQATADRRLPAEHLSPSDWFLWTHKSQTLRLDSGQLEAHPSPSIPWGQLCGSSTFRSPVLLLWPPSQQVSTWEPSPVYLRANLSYACFSLRRKRTHFPFSNLLTLSLMNPHVGSTFIV